MPDWIKIVRERLQPCSLSPQNREDVITELAAHLEEACEQARSAGLPPSAALEQTLQEIDNWRVLANNIRRVKGKEDAVNRRTKTLWIPGLASLLIASLFMTVMQWMGIRPRLLWLGPATMILYWSWLAALPICGALSSYLSQTAGGDARTRLAAASFPVLWLFFLSIPMLPVELAHQGFSPRVFLYFVLGITNWVAIPSCALLLGVLPFLRHSPLDAIPSASHR